MIYKFLNKTTTEIEEEKYRQKAPIRIGKTLAFIMVAIFHMFYVIRGF